MIVIRTFFILVVCTYSLYAQKNIDFNRFDEILEEKYRTGDFSGISLISVNGKVKYEKAFGYADFKDEELLFTDSEFNLCNGSDIAKLLSISWLIEQNKVSLEDSVSQYLPEFEKYPYITLKNILTHTSGLEDINPDNELTKYNDNRSLIEEIIQKQDNVNTGNYKYSHVNSIIIAAVIEKISGLKFEDFFYETISPIIGLPRTEFITLKTAFKHSKADSRYALGYKKTQSEEIIEMDPENETLNYPEGNLWSGGNDILKMYDFLFQSEYISDGTLEKVLGSNTSPVLFKKIGSIENPGYGFEGECDGYNVLFYYFPGTKTQFILLSNYGFSDLFNDEYEILKVINLI
ncbi:serine hydrolase domain-containing protein [Mangrovivirga cuniculi]|uniref:serine hydrolase domain-containing protein n=1 Tax=Mangrovivirga cuniculi TaxID=2715131 RepID=UPI001586F100|nr:serine hydrolase domain-containing protein [Mangrovivirga cuniculi]